MPFLTRLFIKTALLYLVAALLLSLAIAARSVWQLSWPGAAWGPVYFHLFLVGWVTELIFGVAYWMLPRYTREKPRGHAWLLWATYLLLNGGLVLRAVAEPMQSMRGGALWNWLLALAALLQWLAGLAFVANAWPRVKEK